MKVRDCRLWALRFFLSNPSVSSRSAAQNRCLTVVEMGDSVYGQLKSLPRRDRVEAGEVLIEDSMAIENRETEIEGAASETELFFENNLAGMRQPITHLCVCYPSPETRISCRRVVVRV